MLSVIACLKDLSGHSVCWASFTLTINMAFTGTQPLSILSHKCHQDLDSFRKETLYCWSMYACLYTHISTYVYAYVIYNDTDWIDVTKFMAFYFYDCSFSPTTPAEGASRYSYVSANISAMTTHLDTLSSPSWLPGSKGDKLNVHQREVIYLFHAEIPFTSVSL